MSKLGSLSTTHGADKDTAKQSLLAGQKLRNASNELEVLCKEESIL